MAMAMVMVQRRCDKAVRRRRRPGDVLVTCCFGDLRWNIQVPVPSALCLEQGIVELYNNISHPRYGT